MPSQNVEEYIEALYRLGAAEKPVGTGELAERLNVAAPSVTTMLKRLVRDGLVTHEPYRGILLTEAGKKMSVSLLRRHRLSERLLTDMIGLSWERVHEVACKLEHVIVGDLAEQVYNALGKPEICPHGHPVDPSETVSKLALFDVVVGDYARVKMIADESYGFLEYLSNMDLVPGNVARVTDRAAFGDVITVECGTGSYTIGKEVAEKILVELIEREE